MAPKMEKRCPPPPPRRVPSSILMKDGADSSKTPSIRVRVSGVAVTSQQLIQLKDYVGDVKIAILMSSDSLNAMAVNAGGDGSSAVKEPCGKLETDAMGFAASTLATLRQQEVQQDTQHAALAETAVVQQEMERAAAARHGASQGNPWNKQLAAQYSTAQSSPSYESFVSGGARPTRQQQPMQMYNATSQQSGVPRPSGMGGVYAMDVMPNIHAGSGANPNAGFSQQTTYSGQAYGSYSPASQQRTSYGYGTLPSMNGNGGNRGGLYAPQNQRNQPVVTPGISPKTRVSYQAL